MHVRMIVLLGIVDGPPLAVVAGSAPVVNVLVLQFGTDFVRKLVVMTSPSCAHYDLADEYLRLGSGLARELAGFASVVQVFELEFLHLSIDLAHELVVTAGFDRAVIELHLRRPDSYGQSSGVVLSRETISRLRVHEMAVIHSVRYVVNHTTVNQTMSCVSRRSAVGSQYVGASPQAYVNMKASGP